MFLQIHMPIRLDAPAINDQPLVTVSFLAEGVLLLDPLRDRLTSYDSYLELKQLLCELKLCKLEP
jgi:hypothetical protein